MTGFTLEQRALVADVAVNPFCAIDHTGTVVWAGDSVVEVLGIEARDLVGRSVLDFVAPDSLEHAVVSLAAANDYVTERSDSPTWEGRGPVLRLRRADGVEISCAVAVATPVRTGLPYFVLQLRRADASHALELALVAMGEGRPLPEVLERVAQMLEGDLPDAAVAVHRRTGSDPALDQVVGPEGLSRVLEPKGLAGTPWEEALSDVGLVVERPVEELPDAVRAEAAAQGFRWVGMLAVPAPDGDRAGAVVVVWSRHRFAMHVFTHERVRRCADLVGLVVQWERGQRALRWAATHDLLTRLHNRSHFMEQLGEVARSPSPDAAVLYLDLDGFKPVNDLYGHDVGDQVLVAVAMRLAHCVRPDDVVARLGGDEFAVLCRDVDAAVASRLADRLVEEVSEPIMVEGREVQIGLTIGICAVQAGDVPDSVLSKADTALRRAKREGKGRWRAAEHPGGLAPA